MFIQIGANQILNSDRILTIDAVSGDNGEFGEDSIIFIRTTVPGSKYRVKYSDETWQSLCGLLQTTDPWG